MYDQSTKIQRRNTPLQKKMELEFPVMICLNIASLLIEKVLNKFLEELQKIPFHGLMD